MTAMKRMVLLLTLYSAISLLVPKNTLGRSIGGQVSGECRAFPHLPLRQEQHTRYCSLAGQLEAEISWNSASESVKLEAVGRTGNFENKKARGDLRRLEYSYSHQNIEVRAGNLIVFWGVLEGVRLADTINQLDLNEDWMGQTKLGQPLVTSAIDSSLLGRFELFVLPYFRQRRFPDHEARPSLDLPIETRKARFESNERERHVDGAVRWSKRLEFFDIGLFYFTGTDREPQLLMDTDINGKQVLVPQYNLVHISGGDVQLTLGSFLFKLEGRYKESIRNPIDNYWGAGGGVEYAIPLLQGTVDCNLFLEYVYDSRKEDSTTPYDDDFFGGIRLGLNDEASTEFFLGVFYDRHLKVKIYRFETKRRVGTGLQVSLRAFAISTPTPRDEATYSQRRDDFGQLVLTYHI